MNSRCSSRRHPGPAASETTTDETKTKMLAGIGEDAGVVDIGDGWAVTSKVESHNHPSYVEPHQGADPTPRASGRGDPAAGPTRATVATPAHRPIQHGENAG